MCRRWLKLSCRWATMLRDSGETSSVEATRSLNLRSNRMCGCSHWELEEIAEEY